MKLILQIFAVLFAVLLVTQATSYRRRNQMSGPSCRMYGICRWDICPWSQTLYNPNKNCQVVEECGCPGRLICHRSDQIPRTGFIIFQYRCFDPEDLRR